jgi:Xaa-Pro aminopeptidase
VLDLVFKDFKSYIRPGITELEAALWIEKCCSKYGISTLAFPVIVASGPPAADIHHWPGKRKIRSGDFVLLDFGVVVGGYCSDMSRTLIMGNPSKRQSKIYSTLLKAQKKAVQQVKPGVTGHQLDVVVRKVLSQAKLSTKFTHNLGHGVGLAIHEWPRLGKKSQDVLQTNMIVTVEPGLYIKGVGGLRIEDMVRVTKQGQEVLTKSPKDLKEMIVK